MDIGYCMLFPAETLTFSLLGGHQLEYAQMDLCGIFYRHFIIVPSCAWFVRRNDLFSTSNYIYLH